MVFDGDCGFCRRWIGRWGELTGDGVDYRPFQAEEIAGVVAELTKERCRASVQLVEHSGEVFEGAAAVARLLSVYGGRRWVGWVYAAAGPLAERAYRLVAGQRGLFSVVDRLFWGERVEPARHVLVRWVFIRTVALAYLAAILSFWVQVPGLVGERGILPIGARMEAAAEQVAVRGIGWDRFRLLPTLSWFDGSEAFVRFQCGLGVALAVLVMIGVAPGPCLFLLWTIYLSLMTAGEVFMGFQWDALLLETGFLSVCFASGRWLPGMGRERPPSRLILWMLRWLLFRLMIASGWVKLLSGDALWRDLTALTVHYETQPLPTWVAWYAHQLPLWSQKASVLLMFAIELAVPFLIFLPGRARLIPFASFTGLMVVIAVTGNYGFFNFLTAALCLVLLDDGMLLRCVPGRWRGWLKDRFSVALTGRETVASGWVRGWAFGKRVIVGGLVFWILGVTLLQMIQMFAPRIRAPVVERMAAWGAPFRTLNRYGLFAVMTPHRPEIVVEGSRRGGEWRAYGFKYKPGDPLRRPGFVAPHQPRLDWQMWFAALGGYRSNPWFVNFCQRLLEGSPEVLALLEDNPFPDGPPDRIRAMVYEYRFTTPEERRETGAWWKRELRESYIPVLSLRAGE